LYFVYVLRSKVDKEFYSGFTTDLRRRIDEHNRGDQISTKSRIPLELVYYECSFDKNDALNREKYLKSGIGKRFIKSRLACYLKDLNKDDNPIPKMCIEGRAP
jgi:putative endonuclease